MTSLRAGSATDVGEVRTNNEDSLIVTEHLFAVADGMGGHQGGEVASRTAVETLAEAVGAATGGLNAGFLRQSIETANRAVWDRARTDESLSGMGTTLTAIALAGEPPDQLLAIANVGDSRTYLFRDGSMAQLTDDHSLVQDMVRRGQLTAEQAEAHPRRNILTRVLGGAAEVEVDTWEVTPFAGDRFLLASDGLTNEMTDDQISSVLRRLEDPSDAANELVRQAKANGGNDNITVVIVDVIDDDDRSKRASAALSGTGSVESAPSKLTKTSGQTPSPAERDDTELQALDRDATSATSGFLDDAASIDEPSRLTARVLGFVFVLLLLAGIGVGVTAWYARSAYFVGLDGEQVAVFKGRPDGLLWFEPTLAERTQVDRDELLPAAQDELQRGHVVPSVGDALAYVDRLREAAESSSQFGTTTTTAPLGFDNGPTTTSGVTPSPTPAP